MGDFLQKPTTATTTKNTSTQIAPWLDALAQGGGMTAANLPTYSPYTGQGVAPLTPDQLQAITMAGGTAGQAGSLINGGTSGATNALNFAAPQVTAGGLNGQVQGLMNPYIQQVVDATNAQIDRNTGQSIAANDAGAAANGALGGDRQAVADAETRNQADLTKASTAANLLSGGYNNSLATALAAAQGNQNAAINSAGVNIAGTNALTGAGAALSNANTAGINGLLTAGGAAQTTGQNQDTFNYGEYQNVYNSQYQKAQTLAQILGMLPHSTTGNETDTTQGYTSPLAQLLGIGATAAGAYFGVKGPTLK